jgi:hypothetical protein
VLHHLNPLRMDPLRIFTSSIHELLGVTILLLHGIYDNVSSFPPTSMHPCRIGIFGSWKAECQSSEDDLRLEERIHTFYEVGGW